MRRSPNQLQVAEYLCWISTVVGTLVAAVSGRFVFAGVPISLSLLLNLTNRRNLETMAQRQTMAAVAQVHQKLSYDIDRLRSQLGDPHAFSHRPATPPSRKQPPGSDVRWELQQLQAEYQSLHESLSDTIAYLNDSPLPQRIDELELQIEYLTDELERLRHQWHASVPIDIEPVPTETEDDDSPENVPPLDEAESENPPSSSKFSLDLPLERRREPPSSGEESQAYCQETPPPKKPAVPMFSIEGRESSKAKSTASPTLPLSSPPREEPAASESSVDAIERPTSHPVASSGTVGLPTFMVKVPQQQWDCVFTLTDHGDWVSALVVSPDNELLVSASFDKTIQVWRLKTGESLGVLSEHDSPVCALAVSPDGFLLASGSWDKTVKLWDLQKQSLVETLADEEEAAGSVRSLAVSPDGQFAASGWFEGIVQIWQVKVSPKRKRVSASDRGRTEAHRGRVDALAFSPDGSMLASGGADGSIVLWRFDSERGSLERDRSLTDSGEPINALAFSLDGRTLASASRDRTVQLWDLDRDRSRQTLNEHAGSVTSLAVCPDGNTLVSGSADGTVKIWDMVRGRAIATLSDRSDAVMAVAVSADGETLVSGTADGTVKVWRRR
ncbi:WD40 repeat domain-containing protein [Baaleninema simplex]|uniref:WD40 repeat domain-containing protein n=1 Tax=Baaleninema simplex TaxID=2862350 RepID=UPI00034C6E9F|nr:WD40 repeat domain-containing protein [Baaleninema simplex]